ncbi:hypothetical protein [Xanthomonas phage JGB6]|nr:hypothetical protein [Xanthomonas phage JGB6]
MCSAMSDALTLARAVESAVFSCLLNAQHATTDEERRKWESQANKLDSKFKTEFGKHYADFIYPRNSNV